jgi:hypothetical protein
MPHIQRCLPVNAKGGPGNCCDVGCPQRVQKRGGSTTREGGEKATKAVVARGGRERGREQTRTSDAGPEVATPDSLALPFSVFSVSVVAHLPFRTPAPFLNS